MSKKISTVVGDGTQGYSGDGGPSLKSQMDNPFHVEIDPSGKFLYFADCDGSLKNKHASKQVAKLNLLNI